MPLADAHNGLAHLVDMLEQQVQACMADCGVMYHKICTISEQHGAEVARQDAVNSSTKTAIDKLQLGVNDQFVLTAGLEAQVKKLEPSQDHVDVLVKEVSSLRAQVARQETHHTLLADCEKRHKEFHGEITILRHHVEERFAAFGSTSETLASTRASADAQLAQVSSALEKKIAEAEARLREQVSTAVLAVGERAMTDAQQAVQGAVLEFRSSMDVRMVTVERKVADLFSTRLAEIEARFREQIAIARKDTLRESGDREGTLSTNLDRQIADRVASSILDVEARLQNQFSISEVAAADAKQAVQEALREVHVNESARLTDFRREVQGLHTGQQDQGRLLEEHDLKLADVYSRVFGTVCPAQSRAASPEPTSRLHTLPRHYSGLHLLEQDQWGRADSGRESQNRTVSPDPGCRFAHVAAGPDPTFRLAPAGAAYRAVGRSWRRP